MCPAYNLKVSSISRKRTERKKDNRNRTLPHPSNPAVRHRFENDMFKMENYNKKEPNGNLRTEKQNNRN